MNKFVSETIHAAAGIVDNGRSLAAIMRDVLQLEPQERADTMLAIMRLCGDGRWKVINSAHGAAMKELGYVMPKGDKGMRRGAGGTKNRYPLHMDRLTSEQVADAADKRKADAADKRKAAALEAAKEAGYVAPESIAAAVEQRIKEQGYAAPLRDASPETAAAAAVQALAAGFGPADLVLALIRDYSLTPEQRAAIAAAAMPEQSARTRTRTRAA